MSAYSIGVMIDRLLAYSAARKQSGSSLRRWRRAAEGKLEEAVKIADRYKKSHLAKVWSPFAGIPGASDQLRNPGEEIEASKRALDRAQAIVHAELKRGVSGLRPSVPRHRSSACSEPSSAIINAFRGISNEKSTGLGAVAGRYFRSPGNPPPSVCSWPSRRVDVQLLHEQN